MKITDLNGREIIVTDLDAAIARAEEFVEMSKSDPNCGLHRRMLVHWQDVLDKLYELKKRQP